MPMQYGKSQEAIDRLTAERCRVTAPIGRSAAHMDILIDDQKLDRVERRFVSKEEITAAVRSLRERMQVDTQSRTQESRRAVSCQLHGKNGRSASRLGRQGNFPG